MNNSKHTDSQTPARRLTRGLVVVGLSVSPLALVAAPIGHHDTHHPVLSAAGDDVESGSERSFTGAAYDAFLEGRLVTAYTVNQSLNPFDLDVNVHKQKATIGGTVETEVQRDLAIEIASGMDAILDVDDEIAVEPELDTQARQDDGFGDTMDDASTTAAVKTRLLSNDSTSGLSIDVDTNDSVVTLTGRVESDAEAELAKQIAYNTDGVHDVIDKLTVEDATS